MINNVMLVGRLVKDPEILETENGSKVSNITLAVNRQFKGSDGSYHTDFVDCVLWNNFAKNVSTYCTKGDLLGIRGRIQVDTYEKEDGTKRKVTAVVAERITFLSSAKENDGMELSSDD